MQSNQPFDAVIAEVFLDEALFGLAEHFKAPLIGLGTFGAISWNTDMVSRAAVINCIFEYISLTVLGWIAIPSFLCAACSAQILRSHVVCRTSY